MRLPASLSTILLLAAGVAPGARPLAPDPPALSGACAAPEYRQFDFWIGDWDVFESGATQPVARVRVERSLDGCVLHELYEDDAGVRGESLSIFDRTRGVWHQTWMTNGGQLVTVEGDWQEGVMSMHGRSSGNRDESLVRVTWKPAEGNVRETAATSRDRGRTWNTWFDLVFRPRETRASEQDARTVAALDTQYQEAVKHNDVATMAKILADDFVLVTGSGKTFTKHDLLEEALSGRTVYEHQEDTEQVVRVWGDTAVVTAKLWENGARDGQPFDATLWFSDTYVRTPDGWRYVFGQASLPLPRNPPVE
jgi:ketosteroid isomerase-like protein